MNELEKRIGAVVEKFTHVYITHFERQQRKEELREAILALATPPAGHVRDERGRDQEGHFAFVVECPFNPRCYENKPAFVYAPSQAEAARKEGGA